MAEIYENIKERSKEMGIQVKELASSSKVSSGQMSRYLNGKSKMPYDVVVSCMERMGYTVLFLQDNLIKK